MRDIPILFSSPMIRAILSGSKTQTRRVVKLRDLMVSTTKGYAWEFRDKRATWNSVSHARLMEMCPYGQPGVDRLWVRESFAPRYYGNGSPAYKADWGPLAEDVCRRPKWKPSIHMPRTLSRITLEVIDVRVQRLNDITDEDAYYEGCVDQRDVHGREVDRPTQAFRALWDSINGKRAGCAWSDGPWVWAVTFRRM